MARPKGVGGRPGAGHGPPTSRCTGVRRPCRPPRRSLPSCPSEVPAPPGTRGKLRPDAGRLLDSRWGAGPGQRGRGCAAGSEEARRQIRSQSSCNPEPRLQAARRGRGVGRRASAAGGGRRLEAGAGGGSPRLPKYPKMGVFSYPQFLNPFIYLVCMPTMCKVLWEL